MTILVWSYIFEQNPANGQLIASGKSKLLRKVHFPLKSDFQVTAFFILIEV